MLGRFAKVVAVLTLAVAACAAQPLPSAGDAQAGGKPEAGAEPASACAGLDACTCAKTAGCKPVTEACYCPSECDPGIRCICGGGRFLSCAPEGK